jgi:hypothetical protein
MRHSFLFDLDANYIVLILLFLMLIAIWIGFKTGINKEKANSNDSNILSSLLGLYALLLAFTFGMSGTRYENRKANLIEEANCIGTAILRADIYPDSIKKEFKADFKSYVNSRIAYFKSKKEEGRINASIKQTGELSTKLWNRASFYAKDKDYFIQSNMMLPALNEMFDINSKTNTVYNSSVPESIIYLLLIFSVIISFYLGYTSGFEKKLEKIYLFGFCILTCVVIYITLDLDRPRRGLIDLENEIVLLEELKANF